MGGEEVVVVVRVLRVEASKGGLIQMVVIGGGGLIGEEDVYE